MNRFITLSAPLFAGVILVGCASVREVGVVNGVHLTDVRQRGIFTPCKTTLLGHKDENPGEVEVLSDASGPGLIPACATAGGIAGGAALLRPARSGTSVNNDNSSASASTSGNGNITIPVAPRTGPPPHPNVPRQHPNSPGNGGQPGNGGVNNNNN